jgi:hypothetical protein
MIHINSTIPLPEYIKTSINTLISSVCDKKVMVDIKLYRKKRSLDANAYLWVLLDKLARVLNTTKEELYQKAIKEKGVFTYIVVKPKMVERVKEGWRVCEVMGAVAVGGNGKDKGIQIRCYLGSSTYNTKEMSELIDYVVEECKEQGIETITPNELEEMKQKWGVDIG